MLKIFSVIARRERSDRRGNLVAPAEGRRYDRGQAAIETAFALPILVYLLYYTINAFNALHTAHVAQKNAAMNLYVRLQNRAQFAVDDGIDEGGPRVVDKGFLAVQYRTDDGGLPTRRIFIESTTPAEIDTTIGVCREPQCD